MSCRHSVPSLVAACIFLLLVAIQPVTAEDEVQALLKRSGPVSIKAASGYPPQQDIQVSQLGEFLGRNLVVQVSDQLEGPATMRLRVDAISRDGKPVSSWVSRGVEVEPGASYRGEAWTSRGLKIINNVFQPEHHLVMGAFVDGRADVFPDVCKSSHALQLNMEESRDNPHDQERVPTGPWPVPMLCMDWKH